VHVGQWGTFITTPEVSKESATINLKVALDNDAKEDATVSVSTAVFALDADGNKILPTGIPLAVIASPETQIAGGKSVTLESKTTLPNPKLWSPNAPSRYVAVTSVRKNGVEVDNYETKFGIRTLKYDPNAGLFINGEHFKLNGVCDHH